MPKEFIFNVNDHEYFACDLKSEQCSVIKSNGLQCRCKVIIGYQYCHIHLLNLKHLKINESTIEGIGKGLFSVDPKAEENEIIFRPKDKNSIISYGGEVIDEDELNHRYGEYTAPYALEVKTDKYLDGACRRGVGNLINNGGKRNNSRLTVYTNSNGESFGNIRATKNIRNGDEIFVAYGDEYKTNEPTNHVTKNLNKLHLDRYKYREN
jgi:hypothetical protein